MTKTVAFEHVVSFCKERPWCDANGNMTVITRCKNCIYWKVSINHCLKGLISMRAEDFCSKGVPNVKSLDTEADSEGAG